MTADTLNRRDHTFWIGLLAGTAVGAGLAMWLLPHATAELRERVTGSARRLRTSAADRYQQAGTRIDEAVEHAIDDLTTKGQSLRHGVARTIVRGAHEAERIATAIEGKGPVAVARS